MPTMAIKPLKWMPFDFGLGQQAPRPTPEGFLLKKCIRAATSLASTLLEMQEIGKCIVSTPYCLSMSLQYNIMPQWFGQYLTSDNGQGDGIGDGRSLKSWDMYMYCLVTYFSPWKSTWWWKKYLNIATWKCEHLFCIGLQGVLINEMNWTTWVCNQPIMVTWQCFPLTPVN